MTSIKENPKLRAAAEQLRKSGVQIGDAVSETLKTMEESDLMRAVSEPHIYAIVSISPVCVVTFVRFLARHLPFLRLSRARRSQ